MDIDAELQAAFDRGLQAGHESRHAQQDSLMKLSVEVDELRTKLRRYDEREEHVRALFAAWDLRHGALRGLAEVKPIDNAIEAVRNFKLEQS